ncbi:MAG TPA: acetyl-L-homoserine sulfhydrolase [Candidatus Margulisbacteria bacterium]|nr:MAG: hypothetical protein A2X43_12510 [Candidatus Margulisbacteria bacterium GWD2_39_127]OGI04237.1 MAG: hypothetical protein A2X42_05575 [Candidatus Margulisbacteria bacterium GWF2_38_17]OGI07709.1 MAG: hypothetical protein A2X41_04750 [Candidatus Margulisbacteria bacterium GWE2_39_32]HAR62656.1 acetyl-L-homoserine sulfhydrolase [Candidatus Margulisiibacteriota bacterium]HCT86271.1 acetyl-L-homoserine sulfhydrolase [Candidatus Margulisiibacteriota bacterium]
MKELNFNTKAIHGKINKKDIHNSIKYPIYASAAYAFESAEEIEAVFRGQKQAHAYTRVTNPTVEAFELKMTALEDGFASIAVASGMAAITNTFFALLQQGDKIIASNGLFAGTYSLLKNTLPRLGITTSFVDINDLDSIKALIDEKTKVIFFETIANPKMNIPDIQAIADIAHANNLVVIADSSLTSPYLFQAKNYGVDVVIHSSTKFISGGATSIGGVIVDLGTYNWTKYQGLGKFCQLKEWAFISKLRKEIYKDLGSCLSPQSAFLQSIGLETLSLRVERCCNNAFDVARYLESHEQVNRVNYPGLTSSPFHELAKRQFRGLFGAVFTFELDSKDACFKFLNKLTIIKRATNLGDNASLAIHPHSTIYVDCSDEEKKLLGIDDKVIRLSIGIEDREDIIYDIGQALC